MADIITVTYAHIDGAHFFTENDLFSRGLCVAHQDLKIAFEETAVQLKNLLKLNHDLICDVTPAVTFEEFESKIKSAEQPSTHIRPSVRSEVDWCKLAA